MIRMRLHCPKDWSQEQFEVHVRSLVDSGRLLDMESVTITVEVKDA